MAASSDRASSLVPTENAIGSNEIQLGVDWTGRSALPIAERSLVATWRPSGNRGASRG